MKPISTSILKLFIYCLIIGVTLGLAQDDPLATKHVKYLNAGGGYFWAFPRDGRDFSRIDVSTSNEAGIYNSQLPPFLFVTGSEGNASGVMFTGFISVENAGSDVTHDALGFVGLNGFGQIDTLILTGEEGKNQISNMGFNDIAQSDSVLFLAVGKAGIAGLSMEGDSAFSTAPVLLQTITRTGLGDTLTCEWNKACEVGTLGDSSLEILSLDYFSAGDSIDLFLGTSKGLKKISRADSGWTTPVNIPLDTLTDAEVKRVRVNPNSGGIWAFTFNKAFYSSDTGRSFHLLPSVEGSPAPVSEVFDQFEETPDLAFLGDTSFVVFHQKDLPGIAVFVNDSLQLNQGDSLQKMVLDWDDGLEISRQLGRLTKPAVLSVDGNVYLGAGSTTQGVYYQLLGSDGDWKNIIRQLPLEKGLKQVIAYPTLFNGSEPVRLGYQLKDDARVTIEVYNYAMEKVRTIVKNQPRPGGTARSENRSSDIWNGRDDSGRRVSIGTYYILVKTDTGESGWGKAMVISAQ